MKKPSCDCIKKTLNQFNAVDGLSVTTEVYYVSKNNCKGLEETSVFLESNFCPQCGLKNQEDS